MGGTLAVTIREENGKEHRMSRWTNPTPYFINNIDLVKKSQEHLKQYLQTWYDMRKDFETHKEEWEAIKEKYKENALQHDPFENNMTPCYAPYPFLAPQCYGLVVVDMQKNKILSMQEYTAYGIIHAVSAKCDLGQDGKNSYWKQNNNGKNQAYCLREFFEAGRIKRISTGNGNQKGLKKIEEIKSPGELFIYIQTRFPDNNPNSSARFELDISPFEILEFDENSKGATEMRKKIEELDFKINDEERTMWEDWIRECKENEGK